MKTAVSLVLMWVVAAGAVAAEDPVKLLPSPFVLPDRIGPMVLEGEPHKYDDPRLGVSYQYGGDGLSLTVYVYDAGETDLPDGADTIPTCQEFEVAKQGVQQSYQKVALKSEHLAKLESARPAAADPRSGVRIRARSPADHFVRLGDHGRESFREAAHEHGVALAR